MSQYGWADCPETIRAQVAGFREGVVAALREDIIGLYLHGSLAMGCFNPERSDLDLLGVTRQPTPPETKHRLAELLLRFSKAPAPIEISFLSWDDLHPWRHPTPYDFHYSEDWRAKLEQELSTGEWKNWRKPECGDDDLAAHLTITRERGIGLYGKPIPEVFPPVPAEHYAGSIIGDFHWGRERIAQNPVYFVLNACRICAYLRDRRILSKDEGGMWALRNLPHTFYPLIRQALAAYRESGSDGQFNHAVLNKFAAYVEEITGPS